jgi:uncharacterized protein (TIGR03086 family)
LSVLERAIGYTLGCLHLVTPAAMSCPTPCQEWDLAALLRHMNDSFSALHEAIGSGYVSLEPVEPAADLVESVRDGATRLLGAWANSRPRVVSIADQELTSAIVGHTGAVEIAVHGWDVARACGAERPIPARLAQELLHLSLILVTDEDRPLRFGPPVATHAQAGPGELLVAFLGRG